MANKKVSGSASDRKPTYGQQKNKGRGQKGSEVSTSAPCWSEQRFTEPLPVVSGATTEQPRRSAWEQGPPQHNVWFHKPGKGTQVNAPGDMSTQRKEGSATSTTKAYSGPTEPRQDSVVKTTKESPAQSGFPFISPAKSALTNVPTEAFNDLGLDTTVEPGVPTESNEDLATDSSSDSSAVFSVPPIEGDWDDTPTSPASEISAVSSAKERPFSRSERERKRIYDAIQQGKTLVCVDFECWQDRIKTDHVSEIGIASLDAKKITPLELAEFDPCAILIHLEFEHYQIGKFNKYNGWMKDKMICHNGCRRCFEFGNSQRAPETKAATALRKAIGTENRSIVAHAGNNEERIAARLGVSLGVDLDTQVAAGGYADIGSAVGLVKLLDGLGISPSGGRHLHNAGNDAAYELIAAICMAKPGYNRKIWNRGETAVDADLVAAISKLRTPYIGRNHGRR